MGRRERRGEAERAGSHWTKEGKITTTSFDQAASFLATGAKGGASPPIKLLDALAISKDLQQILADVLTHSRRGGETKYRAGEGASGDPSREVVGSGLAHEEAADAMRGEWRDGPGGPRYYSERRGFMRRERASRRWLTTSHPPTPATSTGTRRLCGGSS